RARVPTRRAVARHDQSSTVAPRARLRWLPGWWTLIAGSFARFVRNGQVLGTVPGPRPARPWLKVRCLAPAGGRRASRAGVSDRESRSTKRRKLWTNRHTPGGVPGTGTGPTGRVRSPASRRRELLDAVGELPFEQAVVVDVAVQRARSHELVVRAARGDRAAV